MRTCPDRDRVIGYRRHVAPKPKSLVRTLARRGPHRVLRGDLAFAGMPGVVCTPEAGLGLPAVVFGHGWLTSPERYIETFAHLASWGIVVAAPATARGPVPSARGFAEDLSTTADICTGVRLGRGGISVHPDKVALGGHGFGAGAAVLAAAGHIAAESDGGGHTGGGSTADSGTTAALARRAKDPKVRHPIAAVAALYPAVTTPPAPPAAARLDVPGLVLSAPGPDDEALPPDSADLLGAWLGPLTARIVPAAADGDIVEGRRLAKFLGMPGSDRKLQATTRACLTGYLLATLGDDKTYAAFADPESEIPGTTPAGAQDIDAAPEAEAMQLLGRD